jgi:hypothetical protein
MRKVMLAAGSVLALAIAAPAFAQTPSAASAAPALPGLTAGKGLPATAAVPVARARVAHTNRPIVRARANTLHAGPATGRTTAQVKAPLRPRDRVVKVHTTEGKALLGKGDNVGVKRNGVQITAVGHSQGVNTKKLGLPLTAASNLSAAGQASRRAGVIVAGTPAGNALGAGRNGHGAINATVGPHPSIVNNTAGGRKH